MLAEILVWLTTPASLDARRTGHLTAAVALWSRAWRCRAAWAPHEERCHRIVERAWADLPRRRTCLVLGSGLLRDVPFPGLAAAFERVVLVDVVHLWPARWAARRHPNVTLVTVDVTGTTDLLLGRATGIADPMRRFRDDPTVDLVISANCLSQLPLIPVERIEAQRGLARIRFPDLGHRIVAGHLEALDRFAGRVCLLTDVEEIEVDAGGEPIERLDLLEGVALPPADEEWDWLLAPPGEIRSGHVLHHRSVGFVDLHAARLREGRGPGSGGR
jgi:hypothetical protein